MKIKHKHWFALTASTLGLTGLSFASGFGDEKYVYDSSGNIIEKSIGGVITKMDYDRSNRLVGRQIASQSEETTFYDGAGLPITTEDLDGQQIRSMSYGYGGKVLESHTEASKARFLYNAEGHLVGTVGEGQPDVLVWDGLAMVARGEQVFANEGNAVVGTPVLAGLEAIVSDIVGSTLSVGGKNYTATAYGEGLEEAFMTGKPFVAALDGFSFNHRSYSPDTMRWASPDPSGFPDGENNFVYGGNDPVTNVDPTGLSFFHFTQAQLNYHSGTGYRTKVNAEGEIVGDVTMGKIIISYAAVSNNKNQELNEGMAPQGWYTLGNKSLPLHGDEKDILSNGTWKQGKMSVWSGNNGRETADESLYQNLRKSQWKIGYGGPNANNPDGAGFIPGRLITGSSENFVMFPKRVYGSLKVHPDGRGANTHGCVGITTQADCAAFIANLHIYGGLEMYIAEQ